MTEFKKINGTLCRMVEPEPLTEKAQFPCVVRLIQDNGPMGLYNQDLYQSALHVTEMCVGINGNHDIKTVVSNIPGSSLHYAKYEIIGYPVVEGSAEWALWQAENGKSFEHKTAHHCRIFTMFSETELKVTNEEGEVVEFVDIDRFLSEGAKTGWQLYEEKPEPAKEPEIVAHKQHANCLVCGKEIKGLLDGHATVSIKRYSISSLYESTYSHYCGKCFLELGFDATERELRNRQQPIAEPQPAKEPIANCDNCKHICTNNNIDHCHMYEPQPAYAVGDWVEVRGRGRTIHGKCISTEGRVSEPSNMILACGYLFNPDGTDAKYRCKTHGYIITRKLKPSEVVVHIGCLSGTVKPSIYDDGAMLTDEFVLFQDSVKYATIPLSMLDAPTRELVESLLKAQEEE